MKLIKHDKPPKLRVRKLTHAPLIIWLGRYHELRIEPGDTLRAVAGVIRQFWPHEPAEELAALFFALGERARLRARRQPVPPGWTLKERATSAGRTYLKEAR